MNDTQTEGPTVVASMLAVLDRFDAVLAACALAACALAANEEVAR